MFHRVIFAAFLSACIGDIEENPCDLYVDYLCDCGVATCEELRSQLDSSDLAVQETCRIELDCFERADADATVCVLITEDRTAECLDA